MNGQIAPQFVQAILEWQWTWPTARFALVVYYLVSGLSKIANFRSAITEMAQAGMRAPAAMALLSIFVELAGSVLVLSGRWVWLGAGILGVFTAIGAVTAHAFWRVSGPARVEAITVFLMHLGLIAAFVLCALVAEREGRAAQVAASCATSIPQVRESTRNEFSSPASLVASHNYWKRDKIVRWEEGWSQSYRRRSELPEEV
jgi:uncharacterized membrane protein YphA (DoxX/SURF4 family)